MSKRKQDKKNDDSDSDSDVSLIDVDFDFFDPNPSVDYHALKKLIGQLFQRDADLFHTHELTELILSQPRVGTTIKTDGMESDPYALLTVLNMHKHKDHPSIKALARYFLDKSSTDPAFHATLQGLFSQTESHVGFVLCERLINMPVQVIPPMYRMLMDELKRAINDNEPYTFSHLIVVSRTYHLTEDEETMLSSTQTKPHKSKKTKKAPAPAFARPADGIYSFHPEDEYIKQASIHAVDYAFSTSPNEPRDKESFGLDNRGRMMLVPAENFAALVGKMSEAYAVG
ncbi:p21-C-terminal region-binding protein-domain-containing protein [Desarmillaria ectypa]|nr:p21-C-terminal region-binding protein-domain-containing protein [Desarmillaria ectypa]